MLSIEEVKEHFKEYEFSQKYLDILNYIRENPNAHVSIQGNAGSGKSSLLKIIRYMFSDDIANEDLNVVIASSTGVASALLNSGNNIGATTIHSLFKLKPLNIYGNFEKNKAMNKTVISEIDVLIIDEISMVSSDLFDYIMDYIKVCRSGKPTRIILFGDCLQLQCVVKDEDDVSEYYKNRYNGRHEFFSAYAFTREKFVTFLLTKIYRQNGDDKFIEILNRIRVDEQTQKDLDFINTRVVNEEEYIIKNESFLRIVSTNKDVDKYNKISLDMIDGNYIKLKAEITGSFRESQEFKNGHFAEEVYVKIGCTVMILQNGGKNEDGTYDYYNGNIGILTKIENGICYIDLGDKVVNVPRSTTNTYEYTVDEEGHVDAKISGSYTNNMIRPCSASTIFKCQGLTVNNGYIDFGWWIPPNGIYVALSRFRNMNDFALSHPIKMKDITVAQESLNYVKKAENEEGTTFFGEDCYKSKADIIKEFLTKNNIGFINGKFIDKNTDEEIII